MTSRDGSMRDFPRSLVNFAPAGASPTISGRHNLSLQSGKSNNSGSSPGKKLSKTNHDVIKLVVPFFLWTVLLLGVYLGSWSNLATGSRDLIHTNMVARTRGQTMRTLFFATELTLGDPSFADEREAMQ
ncbi:hypothetical protein DUNSADRAFT_3999 [Dunaliella salina]|uniref:Encoded protein n=1 Tax=Dunaliella salina TaxID=3046 RepID=A0ABQ7FVK5_DUNSA|nr:hypothetical protein DUNSADRAFT_3999 [Dunaliella salina]|eukprot:KAF5826241.1 hypothetical protein DUNSADRAFT_3999 [Dunaliella salina]